MEYSSLSDIHPLWEDEYHMHMSTIADIYWMGLKYFPKLPQQEGVISFRRGVIKYNKKLNRGEGG